MLLRRCAVTVTRRFTRLASTSTGEGNLPRIQLDFEALALDVDGTAANALSRKAPVTREEIEGLVELIKRSKTVKTELAKIQAEQRKIAKRRNSGSNDVESVNNSIGAEFREKGKLLNSENREIESEIDRIALLLPNNTHPEVSHGDYSACRTIKTHGLTPNTDLKAQTHKDHLAICNQLGWVDFESGNTLVGTRWSVLRNEGALLELALINYAMSIALKSGFRPTLMPDVVKTSIADRCGFQPREDEASQTYFVSADQSTKGELSLAGTAEILLAGQYTGQTIDDADLPLRSVALGRAFRAEAGARGKESRGLYRIHQFSKVELFVVCRAEESDAMLKSLVGLQEEILTGLQLPLRVLHMTSEELGSSAYQKYDIEAWMPGRGAWGELASASNCTDYQSRRLSIKYAQKRAPPKPKRVPLDNVDIPIPPHLEATALPNYRDKSVVHGKAQFAHTLNATAAAIPRLIVALVENGVKYEAGTGQAYVELPQILKPYYIGPNDEEGVRNSNGMYCIRWK